MNAKPTRVAILGATGSIGSSALEVIEASEGRLTAIALTAHQNLDELKRLAKRFKPRWVVATDSERAENQNWAGLPADTEVLVGSEAIAQVVAADSVDVVLAAIVGSAGLMGTWSALEAGKTVALANKETLVMGGPLVTQLARRCQARLLPVDSEHSAVFQALQSGHRSEVRRVLLTASGGPFRNYTKRQMAEVTVSDALSHPTWEMGRKITVDSATMMNKALEIIEARWLFDLAAEQIGVVVHPQSIVHSLVEFVDGSVIAQMSPPDMKLPIQYALEWPNRRPGTARKLDFSEALALEFEPPDLERFGALELGLRVARDGGTAGAVLNAANEAAVAEFLEERMRFDEIVPACRAVLDNHTFDPHPTLEQLLKLDHWARQEVLRWVST